MAVSSAYGARYRRIRQMLLDPPVACAHCKQARATELDHDPPLAMHVHREGSGCCRYIPTCAECNRTQGYLVSHGLWRPTSALAGLADEPEPEREGLGASDAAWRKPWLRGLRKVPSDATWPRLMSVPHRRAVGSMGPAFIKWAENRTGRKLRWWQRLVATRLLEVDADGRLVWETLVLSMSRQLGKSWLLRELCFWRIHQGEHFGEPQDVLHTGKDLAICKEVQRPARVWAKARTGYKVREVNGQEEIELLRDGSRWMLRAKEAVYGYAVSVGAADEAWKVRPSSIEEGLTPTMAEREQPQLLLVSTAHRMSTSLMLGRRALALEQLESGEGDLLIEWSAPAGAELDDVAAWRAASPHWTPRRQRMIERALESARSGLVDDPEEPDPIASFNSQWLNQWPRKAIAAGDGKVEELLPAGLWAELAEPGLRSTGPIWVAIEDDYGLGAAVAAAARLEDGRLEVDGWICPDWDTALGDALVLSGARPVKQLLVGASLVDRVPPGTVPAPIAVGGRETRTGLALVRDLALGGQLAHDTAPDLDNAFSLARVREAPTGLYLVSRGPIHLVRAAVWALQAAHRPSPSPAIH